jgi:hypothetical protein
MVNLKNITLISIADKRYSRKTKMAMKYCEKQAFFFDSILIEKDEINEISYSKFCINELTNHIKSDYCLVVQWDGFIINGDLWTDKFLNYDYIGSPWGFPDDCRNKIGNGGFSLRSKKFLEISSSIQYEPYNYETYTPLQLYDRKIAPEDWFLCYGNYYNLINRGIKFPPIELAYKFSVEHPSQVKQFNREKLETYKSFGFHGSFNTGAMKLLEI